MLARTPALSHSGERSPGRTSPSLQVALSTEGEPAHLKDRFQSWLCSMDWPGICLPAGRPSGTQEGLWPLGSRMLPCTLSLPALPDRRLRAVCAHRRVPVASSTTGFCPDHEPWP